MDVSRNRDLPAEQSATEAVTGVRPISASRGRKANILVYIAGKSLGLRKCKMV